MDKLFKYILENYIDGSNKVDSSTKLYEVLVKTLPTKIESILSRSDIIVKGSMGNGNKAQYPWIAIMNKSITESTQHGLYIVYLFKRDMTGFYLSLNQGITFFSQEYGQNKYNNAVLVANYFKSQIIDSTFSKKDINITCGDNTKSLGYGYQKTNIISVYYPKDKLNARMLERDLFNLYEVYDEILQHMSTSSYEKIIKDVLACESSAAVDVDTAIHDMKKAIDQYNDLPVGLYRILTEVVPNNIPSKKYERITKPLTTKIDYIDKAKKDAEIGLLGEELVISHEKQRLCDLGLNEYADKIKWISREADVYGYDIESFDLDENGTVHEIKIEVKTTSSRADTEFFVTKNELEKSKEYKKNYFIYRVYDVKSLTPKFYRASGCISDNFILDPVTYMARYKYS